MLIAPAIVSLAKELVLEGRLPQAENLAFHALFIVTCGVAALVRSPYVHKVVALSGSAFLVAYVSLLFSRLS